MSKEELYKALKIFNREDLTYENDAFYNNFEEYMNIMKQEKAIGVFMSTEDMVKYSKLEQEIERLNNIINELNNAYCKVITKCEEMIDNRFYMNDIAIKRYADEIKDICKYYVGEAKELKGSEKE